MESVSDIFEAWPSPKVANVARDIGVTTEHAAQMKNRNSIPVKYWAKLVAASETRGVGPISYDTLVSLHGESNP